jgi:adenosylcobinamide hydrolase
MPGVYLSRTEDVVHVGFSRPHRVLSSATLNGGYCEASNYLNVRVAKHSSGELEDPSLTLQRLSDQLNCAGITVGMMTAASLDSLRVVCEIVAGETLAVLVTTGLENARRAGDTAEYRSLEVVPPDRGTINLAIVTSAEVAEEALVEVVAVATEAKVAVLHDLRIVSPVSGRLATGTGTDAIAVFSAPGGRRVRFAGKHTLLGERLAIMVMNTIRSSVNFKQEASD